MADTNNLSIQLDTSSSIPLYRQLANIIRDGINNGEYRHDSQIPTETALSTGSAGSLSAKHWKISQTKVFWSASRAKVLLLM